MNELNRQADRENRRLIWPGLIAIAAVAATLIRVPTTLGLKVPETNIPGIDPSSVDTSGREYIWRVWWRARDDLVTFEPQWLVTLCLGVLLAVFAVGLVLAVWLALASNAQTTEPGE